MTNRDARFRHIADQLALPADEDFGAAGQYAPWVRCGEQVFISGQLPKRGGELALRGLIGAEVSVEDGRRGAMLCAARCIALLQQAARHARSGPRHRAHRRVPAERRGLRGPQRGGGRCLVGAARRVRRGRRARSHQPERVPPASPRRSGSRAAGFRRLERAIAHAGFGAAAGSTANAVKRSNPPVPVLPRPRPARPRRSARDTYG